MKCDQLENSVHTVLLESLQYFIKWQDKLIIPVLHYQAFFLENGTKYCRCEGMGHRGHNFHRIEHPVLHTILYNDAAKDGEVHLVKQTKTTIGELNTQI